MGKGSGKSHSFGGTLSRINIFIQKITKNGVNPKKRVVGK
jgi:hypothetical protein